MVLFYILVGVILFFVLIFGFLIFAILWLPKKDKLQKADVIVVPTGDMYIRSNEAIQLLKESWSNKIIFSGKTGSKNALELKKRAIEKGVKEKQIITETQSTNSLENAIFTKKILKEKNFNLVILVTSPYAARRQYKTFKKVLKNTGIKIITHPVKNYNWLIKTPGKNKYRWQYLIEEPYYILKYWLKGDIR